MSPSRHHNTRALAGEAPGDTVDSDAARFFEHELVHWVHDHDSGLRAIVAIHSTALGPAMGGLRLRRYASFATALEDVLELSRAMTLKNSLAGLSLGGGKAVIVAPPGALDRTARVRLMRAFGRAVAGLGGRYIAAEDVGTTPSDMDMIGGQTEWVVGRSRSDGGHGDPSPSTAVTVEGSIRTALSICLGSDSVEGKLVGIVGVGKVGGHLARRLARHGAKLLVSDLSWERAARVAAETGAHAMPVEQLLAQQLDVLAPCATGGMISSDLAPALSCRIIAGAANNPLTAESVADDLARAGILYVPDFVANCGGIIQVAAEFEGFDARKLDADLSAATMRCQELLEQAQLVDRTPLAVALDWASARLARA